MSDAYASVIKAMGYAALVGIHKLQLTFIAAVYFDMEEESKMRKRMQ